MAWIRAGVHHSASWRSGAPPLCGLPRRCPDGLLPVMRSLIRLFGIHPASPFGAHVVPPLRVASIEVRSDQTVLVGGDDELCPVVGLQLGHDAVDVGLGGVR